MEAKSLNATLEERVSQKGNPYICVVLKLTPTYEKIVFLEPAEVELVKSQQRLSK